MDRIRTCGIALVFATLASTAASLAKADEIALSLVHGDDRIDVPASAVTSVTALPNHVFRNSVTGKLFASGGPHVEICFNAAVSLKICQLTQRIIKEPLEVWVSCHPISKPVVLQALCSNPCIGLNTFELKEAERLVVELKAEPKLACP